MWNKHRATPAENEATNDHAERLMAAADALRLVRNAEAAETDATGEYVVEDAAHADDDRRTVWRLLGL